MHKTGQNPFSQIETIPLSQNSNWFLLGLHNPIDFNTPLQEKQHLRLIFKLKACNQVQETKKTQYPSLRFEHAQQNNSIKPLIKTKRKGGRQFKVVKFSTNLKR